MSFTFRSTTLLQKPTGNPAGLTVELKNLQFLITMGFKRSSCILSGLSTPARTHSGLTRFRTPLDIVFNVLCDFKSLDIGET